MDNYVDWALMAVAGGLIAIWVYRAFYRWLHTPTGSTVVLLGEATAVDAGDEHVALMEDAGYDVISGKQRIPLSIQADGQAMASRLFIDYVAERKGKTYLVKVARERKPLEWTGSALRDRLFVYQLLVPQCHGILYIDLKDRSIRQVVFTVEEQG